MIKENVYFDGNVKSLGFSQQDGESTVGVMTLANTLSVLAHQSA